MMSYSELNDKLDGIEVKLDASLLDEVGNISSGMAIKRFNDCIKHGRRVLSNRNASDVEKLLARMIADGASLSLVAIAVSGGKSTLSSVAKGASLRGL